MFLTLISLTVVGIVSFAGSRSWVARDAEAADEPAADDAAEPELPRPSPQGWRDADCQGRGRGLRGAVPDGTAARRADGVVQPQRYLDFPVEDYSTQWYSDLVTDSQWRTAVDNSLLIGLASATLAVLVALPLAYAVHTYRPRLAPALFALGVLPFMLPPVISRSGCSCSGTGSATSGRSRTWSSPTACSSRPCRSSPSRWACRPSTRRWARRRRPWGPRPQRFRTVTLPLLVPSIVTGFVAAFVLSLNEYIIAFMVAGFSVETLPIKIFNSLRYGFTPTIAAVSVVFTLLSVVALGILARFGGLERLLGADLADR